MVEEAAYVASRPTVTLAGARAVVDASLARAADLGVAVNVSVCDAAGHEVAFARMDGAALLSADIARDKAYSVTAFLGIPTERWFAMIEDAPALREGIVHRDRLVIFAGGVPLTTAGATVGAVGVSGGTAEQDQEVATAGAAVFG